MHKQYLILVWKNKRLWCRVEVDCPWSNEVVRDILSRLPAKNGYSFEFFMAVDERRIIESYQDGVRLLVREPVYKPVSLVDLFYRKN